MFKKIALGSLILIACSLLTAFAVNVTKSSDETAAKAPVTEAVSTTPEHCNPADCTPEKAAMCPYSGKSDATATNNANCPTSNECPASKCSSSASSDKATL